MDNYFESLKFNYSKETGQIKSIRVVFSDLTDDSILISQDYVSEIMNFVPEISENDKDLFFIIARAIQLKSENKKGSSASGRVKKYDFSSKSEPFYERFIPKLMKLTQYVPIETIAAFFGEDAKVEDLDIFLNRKDIYALTLLIRDGIDEEDDDLTDDDDFY